MATHQSKSGEQPQPPKGNPSPVERIKKESDGLRGTIQQSLTDAITGQLREDDQSLIKFHGMYQQDDRDRREERAAKKLDRLYSFMIRLRLPGGFLTPEQWVAVHHIAGAHSTGVIKITTRQTLQLHGILKSHIKPTIQKFHLAKLDSIATCGDINRNVIVSAHPNESPVHATIHHLADKISKHLMPKTRAYYEIWLDEEKIVDKKEEADPLYEDRYLPRKFKIAIAIPPNNDPDVFANDIGIIAIIENNQIKGYNLAVGGGLSTTHGNPDTYARLATVLGFVDTEEKLLKAVYEVLTIQRDYGNRSDRKLARVKYTIDRVGVDWFRAELERRSGFSFEEPKPYSFTERTDRYGWEKDHSGAWHYTVFAENGRVLDDHQQQLKSALLEITEAGLCNIRFTGNQGLIVADVKNSNKKTVHSILEKHGVVKFTEGASRLRKNSMACVAMPTCPLALAEGQRYLPELITKMEALLDKHGLLKENIITRMTGCPNGCGRSHVSEIGFVGTGPGKYNLHLGGDHAGNRLNKIYKESLNEKEILETLDQLFQSFAQEKNKGEHFGDFAVRKNWVQFQN